MFRKLRKSTLDKHSGLATSIPAGRDKVRKFAGGIFGNMVLGKSRFWRKPQEKFPQGPEKVLPEIPRDSPLGWMLEHSNDSPRRAGRSKEKMIHFCMEKWGGKEIRKYVVWPVFGTFEAWTCKSLYDHVFDRHPQDFEEIEYAEMWRYTCTSLYLVRAHLRAVNRGKKLEPLDSLPPPYLVPPPQPGPAQAPPVPALPLRAAILLGHVSALLLPCEQPLPPTLPKTEEKQVTVPKVSSPLAHRTRWRMRRATTGDSEDEEEKPGVFPLWEVRTAPGVIGFVHMPVDTS